MAGEDQRIAEASLSSKMTSALNYLNAHPWFAVLGVDGVIAFLIILGVLALRGGSYLYQLSPTILVFRRRQTERAFAAIMGSLVTLGGLFAFGPKILTSQNWGDFFFLMLLCVACGSLLLWRTGPQEIHIDIEKRTYRLISGPPIFPKTQRGLWKDFQGVYVWGASQGYVISIAWVDGKRHGPMLGRFRFRTDADRFAQEMSSILGLRRIKLSA